jgi:hypothetical protein
MEHNRMKINSNILKQFLKKVSLDGSIEGSVLIFEDEGMKIWLRDLAGVVVTLGLLKKESFTEYEKFENIGIKENKIFIKLLNGFKKDIEILRRAGKLILKDEKREVEIIEGNENYIDNKLNKLPNIQFTDEIEMKSEILYSSIKNMEDLESIHLKIFINDTVLNVEVGEEGFNKIVEKEDLNYKDMKSLYGMRMKDIVKQLGDKIKISLSDNYPLQIKEEDDNWSIRYIIAPMME